jgi:hypothetical protein
MYQQFAVLHLDTEVLHLDTEVLHLDTEVLHLDIEVLHLYTEVLVSLSLSLPSFSKSFDWMIHVYRSYNQKHYTFHSNSKFLYPLQVIILMFGNINYTVLYCTLLFLKGQYHIKRGIHQNWQELDLFPVVNQDS